MGATALLLSLPPQVTLTATGPNNARSPLGPLIAHPVTSGVPASSVGGTGLDRETAGGWGSQRPGWSQANENLVGVFEKPLRVPVS